MSASQLNQAGLARVALPGISSQIAPAVGGDGQLAKLVGPEKRRVTCHWDKDGRPKVSAAIPVDSINQSGVSASPELPSFTQAKCWSLGKIMAARIWKNC